ncbi:MAG: PLP-dependent aminotransferase family protein [bacterium]|nr:PLP-dependent aminotransferase family protein [bacterium]
MVSVLPPRPALRERATLLRDLPLDGQGALYDQIYRSIRDAILSGRVAAGTRLPTTRALAEELGVSRNTVVSAFEPLQAEGYVVSRVGAGTFVAPQLDPEGHAGRQTSGDRKGEPSRPAHPPVRLSRYGQRLAERSPRTPYDLLEAQTDLAIDFRPCVPDLERLSYEAWRRHLARTAHYAPPLAFDYADPSGVPELREAIAGYLARARAVYCEPDELVVVGGVAQALDLATRLFVDPGDAVLLEDPHYLGARRHFEAAGAEIVGAPVDREGLDLGRVDREALAQARLAYVTPSHQYPTGVVLSLRRRQALLDWAGANDAYVVEDDYDSEFRYKGRAIPSLKSLDEGGRVLYVGTFSKTLLPSMRIAYLVVPPALRNVFRNAKWLADWSTPSFEQHALARFLESGDFERHLRRARTLYGTSREVLVEALGAAFGDGAARFDDSGAGLHLLVRFPGIPAARLRAIVERASARGVGVYPAAPSYLKPDPGADLELVMGFARLSPESIREGVGILADVLGEVR